MKVYDKPEIRKLGTLAPVPPIPHNPFASQANKPTDPRVPYLVYGLQEALTAATVPFRGDIRAEAYRVQAVLIRALGMVGIRS